MHWTSIDDDEILLGVGSQFQGDPFSQFTRHGILNEPGLMYVLAILNEVLLGLVVRLLKIIDFKGKNGLNIILGCFSVILTRRR